MIAFILLLRSKHDIEAKACYADLLPQGAGGTIRANHTAAHRRTRAAKPSALRFKTQGWALGLWPSGCKSFTLPGLQGFRV